MLFGQKMRYREFGNSGQRLSEIGLGTWAIGGGEWGMGWGDQSKEDSIDAILEALECGINWIDTAHLSKYWNWFFSFVSQVKKSQSPSTRPGKAYSFYC